MGHCTYSCTIYVFSFLGGHEDLPCVKAFDSVFGKYGRKIQNWIFEFISSKDEDELRQTKAKKEEL